MSKLENVSVEDFILDEVEVDTTVREMLLNFLRRKVCHQRVYLV